MGQKEAWAVVPSRAVDLPSSEEEALDFTKEPDKTEVKMKAPGKEGP
jgi:hypothetical protein